MYTFTALRDDSNRVGCPDYDDNVQTLPETPELLNILEDDLIFWEAFSLDGIDQVYAFPNGRFQVAANRQRELDFQRDINDAIATQNFEGLGKLVATHMMDYAEKIWRIRNE
ncbi:MAG: hypothetical protein ACR2PP_04420 [Psychrobacter sp.]